MESRLERNLKKKKRNNRKKIKFIVIFCLFLLLIFAIEIVNQRIIELNYFENPTILKINIDSRTIEWFGKTYIIDINKMKKMLEDRFYGLFVLHKVFYLL